MCLRALLSDPVPVLFGVSDTKPSQRPSAAARTKLRLCWTLALDGSRGTVRISLIVWRARSVVSSPPCDALTLVAIDAEGLFRVSGAVREVEDLLKQFEKGTADLLLFSCVTASLIIAAQTSGKKVDLSKIKDPHVVAGVTKAWVRFPDDIP